MVGSPLVEPSAPKLGAHERRLGTQLLESGELLVNVGARAEVHCPDKVVEAVVLEVGCPVALEKGDVGAEVLAQHVADCGHVRLVGAVAAVFVLHLNHDDRSALVYGEVADLPGHFLLEEVHALEEVGVGFAQAYVLVFQEPPRESSHFPLGADVRAGTQDNLHVVVAAELNEGAEVILAGEVKLTLARLVDVPEDV